MVGIGKKGKETKKTLKGILGKGWVPWKVGVTLLQTMTPFMFMCICEYVHTKKCYWFNNTDLD